MKYRPSLAAAIAAAALLPALASAGWEVEPTHTNIGFEVGHLGLTKTPGQFRKFSAGILLDEAHPEKSRASFTIDANSVDTLVAVRDSTLCRSRRRQICASSRRLRWCGARSMW